MVEANFLKIPYHTSKRLTHLKENNKLILTESLCHSSLSPTLFLIKKIFP